MSNPPTSEPLSDMHEFAKVLRQALLMIVRYLEKKYNLGQKRE